MDKLYKQLLEYLQREDKQGALNLCIDALKKKEIDVVSLYESMLGPALNNIIYEHQDDENNLIWKEHVRSAIIRTIIENAYPFVLKERARKARVNGQDVIVMCPRFEDHDLGARMVSDFYTIAGFNSTFIGANTPERTILKAIESIRPKYVSISVSNYYNLVAVKKTINQINQTFDYKIKFIVGGNAFKSNSDTFADLGGDLLLKSYADILELSKEEESK